MNKPLGQLYLHELDKLMRKEVRDFMSGKSDGFLIKYITRERARRFVGPPRDDSEAAHRRSLSSLPSDAPVEVAGYVPYSEYDYDKRYIPQLVEAFQDREGNVSVVAWAADTDTVPY
ncbi:MAG: hypothetical protein AB7U75_14880 [Hyphomicrobiaceae bacterium]